MSVTIRIVVQPSWVRTMAALHDKVNGITAAIPRIPSKLRASINPAAITALALGLWRLTTDLGITEWFPVSSGFFSHWQAWIALAIAIKFIAASLVDRIAKTPRPLA